MVLFLIASGLSLIFGVTRIVNFAHGSFYMLAAYLTYTLAATLPLGAAAFYVAVLLAAASVGLAGLGVEVALLRRVYRAPELYQLLLTFALVLVVADVVKLFWGSENLTGPAAPGLAGSVEIAGQLFPTYDLALIGLGPLVAAGLWWLFYRTRWGVLIRAATQDREMVAVLGVDQARLFTSVFVLGSFLAGLGGGLPGARAAPAQRLGARGDPRLRAVRREPPPPHGHGRDGVVRPRRQLRPRRLRRGAARDVDEGADAPRVRRRAPGRRRGRRPLRLLLRAPVVHLLRDAHARLCPDRLRDRPPVVRRHGRRQRPARHLAGRVARRTARLLLPGAHRVRRGDRPPRAHRPGAVRAHAPGRPGPRPPRPDGPDQHPAPPVDGVRRRGVLRRRRRGHVRVPEGQRVPQPPGGAVFG